MLDASGQTQVLRYYETLSPTEQESLLRQIENLDLTRDYKGLMTTPSPRGQLAPPTDALTLPEIQAHKAEYRQIGLEAIRTGKVAAVLLAGGQGTRLGFAHPKGMFNIGKTRTLYIFQCLIQNLMAVVQEAGTFVPLFIMTSEENTEETQSFLAEHQYFGYDADYITFFTQETEPVVDGDGKILLRSKGEILRAPNGNGGWFHSMARSGLIERLQAHNIEWLNVFAVDNVLQQIADPVFIGATIASGCVSAGKVVRKANPEERVGVLCLEDGKPSIVEYYEMTDEMRERRDAEGNLAYAYGVILNYLFRVDGLLKTLDHDFPLHIAHKKMTYLGEDGERVEPTAPNAYKFETLVLDMVHTQESCLAYEVEREREFAPVKNAEGEDSVVTAQALLEKQGILL